MAASVVPKNIQIAYFCEYSQEVELKGSRTIPTIVEIKHLYVNEQIISDKETLSFEVEANDSSKFLKG
jgi:hypothetical protein